jgi:hypothetical protein
MATNVVNLDALIPREDLGIKGDPSVAPARTTTIRVRGFLHIPSKSALHEFGRLFWLIRMCFHKIAIGRRF